MPGEEDVRQKRINMKNMFPYVCPVRDDPSKLTILFEARQIVSLVRGGGLFCLIYGYR